MFWIWVANLFEKESENFSFMIVQMTYIVKFCLSHSHFYISIYKSLLPFSHLPFAKKGGPVRKFRYSWFQCESVLGFRDLTELMLSFWPTACWLIGLHLISYLTALQVRREIISAPCYLGHVVHPPWISPNFITVIGHYLPRGYNRFPIFVFSSIKFQRYLVLPSLLLILI